MASRQYALETLGLKNCSGCFFVALLRARLVIQYDLILMDIQMPNINGIDAAHLTRQKLGKQCPFIFALTAQACEGDKERFLGLGFDGYLSKPLETIALQDALIAIKATTNRSSNHSKTARLIGETKNSQ
jgi:CheY-like chemotaxis protein